MRSFVDRSRYLGIICAVAVGLLALEAVLLGEVFDTSVPLLSRLGHTDRVEFYKQVATLSGALLGFILTAVAILVSLDGARKIVQHLQLGESFSLLVVNLLWGAALLFVTATISISGAVFDDGLGGSSAFEWIYEGLLTATFLEVVFALGLFAVVMFRVAENK